MKFILLIITILFTSCLFEVRDPNRFYDYGQKEKRFELIYDHEVNDFDSKVINNHVIFDNNMLYIDLFYTYNENGLFRFEINITNKTNLIIVFDPVQLYYESYPIDNKMPRKIYAVDPQERIMNLKRNIEIEKNYNPNDQYNVYNAWNNKKNNFNATQSDLEKSHDREASSEQFEMHNYRLHKLEEKLKNFEISTIKHSEIKPKNTISGVIYFYVYEQNKKVKMTIPIDNNNYSCIYIQNEY
jgi:hypothetical protein